MCMEEEPTGEPSHWDSLNMVEELLGYEFNNRRLLEEAFTHPSYSENTNSDDNNSNNKNSFSYERLEYMGDSMLNLMITTELFFLYPDCPPGSLTQLRAANVDTEKLARVALKHGLHHHLRHNKPLLQQQIQEFEEAVEEYPLHSYGLIHAPKALADIVESTIGAVYVDCRSIDAVWNIFKNLLEPMIDMETLKTHPVTELHQICQKRRLRLEFKDTWAKNGEIAVYIEDEFVGKACHSPKKEIAQNRAAKDALNNFTRVIGDKDNSPDAGLNE